MQEKLDALVRTQAMQLFRQQGLHFTMHIKQENGLWLVGNSIGQL